MWNLEVRWGGGSLCLMLAEQVTRGTEISGCRDSAASSRRRLTRVPPARWCWGGSQCRRDRLCFPISSRASSRDGRRVDASIVSEYVTLGGRTYQTVGLGALIADSANNANFTMLAAGTLTMAAVVLTVNAILAARNVTTRVPHACRRDLWSYDKPTVAR